MAFGNHSVITEFILPGLSTDPQVEDLLFVLFLGIYVLTLTGNLLLLVVISADSQLRTPMYFFLSHLSFLDLCFSSVTLPKMLENLLSQNKSDLSGGLGFLDTIINVPLAMQMDFCKTYTIPHYSCELPSLFALSCSDVSTNLIVMLCSIIPHGAGTSLLIFFSYACILSTVLGITSTSGRSRAFSTCSSHLTTVILFYGSSFLRYLMPTSGSSLELMFSVQYSVLTPMLNPLIYSVRNKEVKTALRRMLGKDLQYLQGQNEGRGRSAIGTETHEDTD